LRFFRPFFKINLKKITRNIEGCVPKICNLYNCRQLTLYSFGDGHGRHCNKIDKWWIALSSISSLNCRHIFFTIEHAPTTLLSCTKKCKLQYNYINFFIHFVPGAFLVNWRRFSDSIPRVFSYLAVATLLWAKWENATPTPKSENLECSRTPENSEDDLRGQISLPWCVLYVIGKVLKNRCPKWPHMSHLDICSSSYGQKKGRESKWQFDSRPLKVRNRPLHKVRFKSATWLEKLSRRATTLLETSSLLDFAVRSYELPKFWDSNSGHFRDSNLGVPGKRAIRM